VKLDRREFQFVDGLWKKLTVRFGRIGTTDQAKENAFGGEDAARRYDRIVLGKTRNGSIETAASDASGSMPMPVTNRPAPPTAAASDDSGAASAGVEAAAAPRPRSVSAEPIVAAPDAPPLRRMKLTDEDRQRVRWLPREPVSLPPPPPFSIDACLEQLKSALDDADNFYTVGKPDYRYMIAKAIPPRLTKEEAWLWLNVLDTPNDERERVVELARQVAAAGLHDNARARARAELAARRSDYICPIAPHTLRPFFTPIEIAEFIMASAQGAIGSRLPYGEGTVRPMLAFSRFVVPQMSAEERSRFRGAMERMYDAEPAPSSGAAVLRLAFLSTVGGGDRLAAWVAGQPDGAWAFGYYGYNLSSGYLDVLAGLADEASFVREARRLIGRLTTTSDLRLWLAATEWRELDLAKNAVVGMNFKDDRATMARLLALVEAPEAVLPMLELQLGSKAQAIAANWLSAHPLAAAVGLTPVARGQGKLAEAARERLHTMRRSGLQATLTAAIPHLTPEQGAWLKQEILDVAEETLPELGRAELPAALQAGLAQVKATKPPGWLSVASLPPIKFRGKKLAAAEVATVLAALKATGLGASSALVSALKQEADRHSLDAFAWKLFDLWRGVGSPSKDRWAMAAIGHLGGDACVLKLTPVLREWPGESQHTRAVFGLECLRAVGSDTALTALNGIAQKLKFKGLKQKAQEMMEGIAQARGFTREQLADRIVPDCGLDARGSRVFDFGPRQFRFVLGPEMKPLVREESGKVRSDLPAPTKADDPDKAEAAVTEWKLLKKTLREVLKIQAERLEDAMISGRRWTPEELETLLVKHPLMVNLVRQLVLAAYDDAGKVTQTFRVTEDQTLADQNDEEVGLPSGGSIGIVHPAHLDEAAKSAWGQVLGDYAVIPPFAQLGRDICRPDPDDLEATAITRYRGPKIPGIVMFGMLERSQWLRDPPGDGGGFTRHSKHFPSAGLTAFIKYTGLAMGYKEEPQELEDVYFVPGHVKPERWVRHENRLAIKDVDTVVISEVLRLANAIVSKAE
jgi:hypothetical protein